MAGRNRRPAKRGVTLNCLKQTEPQADVPDLWLLFAPVKKTPSDYLAQKATELGVSLLQPVLTRRTIVTRINPERLAANAVEAAEQSGRFIVPEIARSRDAGESYCRHGRQERRLYFCDEGGDAKPLAKAAQAAAPPPSSPGRKAALIPPNATCCGRLPFVTPVTLGPRILRADTAALAALAIWQSVKGDWAYARMPQPALGPRRSDRRHSPAISRLGVALL